MADRSMKIYINHPQTICIHLIKWRLKIPSRLGEVWRQRTPYNAPNPPSPREVPMADRFMKNYINHPQTTCTHPVKWGLEIPSCLGGVRGQRTPPQNLPQTRPPREIPMADRFLKKYRPLSACNNFIINYLCDDFDHLQLINLCDNKKTY